MTKDSMYSDLHKHFFQLVFQVKDHMQDLVREAESGLTTLQIMVLRLLVLEKELTQHQICQFLNKDKAQIARLIAELVNKGLVQKYDNPNDKRSFILKPNPKVQKIVKDFIQIERQLIMKMVAGMTSHDLKSMILKFEVMSKNLNQY